MKPHNLLLASTAAWVPADMQSAFSNDLDLLLSGPGLGDGLDFDLLGFAPATDLLLLPPLKEEEKPGR